jgi:hypothetical protein
MTSHVVAWFIGSFTFCFLMIAGELSLRLPHRLRPWAREVRLVRAVPRLPRQRQDLRAAGGERLIFLGTWPQGTSASKPYRLPPMRMARWSSVDRQRWEENEALEEQHRREQEFRLEYAVRYMRDTKGCWRTIAPIN